MLNSLSNYRRTDNKHYLRFYTINVLCNSKKKSLVFKFWEFWLEDDCGNMNIHFWMYQSQALTMSIMIHTIKTRDTVKT